MKGRAYVVMTWDVLGAALKGHDAVGVTSNLPADAVVEHIVLDDLRRIARVYLTSDSFEPVNEGHEIPEFNIALTLHTPERVEWSESSRWPRKDLAPMGINL